MKKAILLLAFPLALTACGGGGPEGDAQKMCDLMTEWKTAKEAGKNDEAQAIEEKGEKIEDEMKEKYKDDEAGGKTFETIVEECEDKMRSEEK